MLPLITDVILIPAHSLPAVCAAFVQLQWVFHVTSLPPLLSRFFFTRPPSNASALPLPFISSKKKKNSSSCIFATCIPRNGWPAWTECHVKIFALVHLALKLAVVLSDGLLIARLLSVLYFCLCPLHHLFYLHKNLANIQSFSSNLSLSSPLGSRFSLGCTSTHDYLVVASPDRHHEYISTDLVAVQWCSQS